MHAFLFTGKIWKALFRNRHLNHSVFYLQKRRLQGFICLNRQKASEGEEKYGFLKHFVFVIYSFPTYLAVDHTHIVAFHDVQMILVSQQRIYYAFLSNMKFTTFLDRNRKHELHTNGSQHLMFTIKHELNLSSLAYLYNKKGTVNKVSLNGELMCNSLISDMWKQNFITRLEEALSRT